MVFNWVLESFPKVFWIRESRWVVDGDIYTSSGVSAGIDMSIQFIADYISLEKAVEIANVIEHEWNDNSDHDPFAELYI